MAVGNVAGPLIIQLSVTRLSDHLIKFFKFSLNGHIDFASNAECV